MGFFFGQGYYTGICMILISWAVLCSLHLNSGRFHWFVVLTNIHKAWNKSESWPTIREEIKKKQIYSIFLKRRVTGALILRFYAICSPTSSGVASFVFFADLSSLEHRIFCTKKKILKDVKLTVSTTKNLNKLDASISRTKIVATGNLINIWGFFLASKYSYRISQFLSSFYHLILQNMPQS